MGLRGPVRECNEETDYSGASGERSSAMRSRVRNDFEFDPEGLLVRRTVQNPDGSEWEARFSYDPSGLPLKTISGMKGSALKETANEYDGFGRIQRTTSSAKSLEAATYIHDERGRKKKVQVSRREDYRPNLSFGGSPFEANDHAPNLPNGGTAATLYNEQDRPYEIEVRDEHGELVKRVTRTYDEKGNIEEETVILPDPTAILPAHLRERVLDQPGASLEDLRDQLSKIMAGQSGPYSVRYEYDVDGRVIKVHRRIFDREETVETSYNDRGDESREVTCGKVGNDVHEETSYCETVYSYRYDSYGNWTEKTLSHRLSPGDTFKVNSITMRTLTYC